MIITACRAAWDWPGATNALAVAATAAQTISLILEHRPQAKLLAIWVHTHELCNWLAARAAKTGNRHRFARLSDVAKR